MYMYMYYILTHTTLVAQSREIFFKKFLVLLLLFLLLLSKKIRMLIYHTDLLRIFLPGYQSDCNIQGNSLICCLVLHMFIIIISYSLFIHYISNVHIYVFISFSFLFVCLFFCLLIFFIYPLNTFLIFFNILLFCLDALEYKKDQQERSWTIHSLNELMVIN